MKEKNILSCVEIKKVKIGVFEARKIMYNAKHYYLRNWVNRIVRKSTYIIVEGYYLTFAHSGIKCIFVTIFDFFSCHNLLLITSIKTGERN